MLILYLTEGWAEKQELNIFVYILLLHKKLFLNVIKTLALDTIALNSGVKGSLQARGEKVMKTPVKVQTQMSCF